uniref:Uncharacterized protein n=1 Tax=Rhizophora mucronata TaxID=61149 RepID=A0A2P2N0W5_RHIMU
MTRVMFVILEHTVTGIHDLVAQYLC